jgi:CheY-like chemotaxis protein
MLPNSPINCLTSKRSLVLAIDDDDDNLFMLNCALEPLDFEFAGRTSGKSALAFIKEHLPDLILLDILLPDIHGLDLIHQLKQDPRTQHIPVIAVTGLATEDDHKRFLEAGFSDYLSKPYPIDDLETLVQNYLSPSRP